MILTILHIFLWPFTAGIRLLWEFKWFVLAGVAVLILLSAVGVFG